MKNFITKLVVCFLFSFSVNAQIYEGDISVNTQADVDALSSVFNGVSEINGTVFIGEEFGKESDIHDLFVFQSIKRINKSLYVKNNPLLESLSGLDSLRYIGIDLYITGNITLINYCAISEFSFDEAYLYSYFSIEGNGYNPDVNDFLSTCSGELEEPELEQTFIPDWEPGEGGLLNVPDLGESTSDFVGLYLKSNVFKSNVFSSGGYVELIFGTPYLDDSDSLTVECSEDGVTWDFFMDNRNEHAIFTMYSTPSIVPNKVYYYRLKANNGDLSNVIYVDRFASHVAFSSTGFGGSIAWPPMDISGSYRIYDNDGNWITGTDNTKLIYQWFRVNPITFEFTIIDGAVDSVYMPNDEDYGYKIAATVSLDGEMEEVNCYASYTYVSYDAMQVPLPVYISNVDTKGFDLNLYHCINDTLDVLGFSTYASDRGDNQELSIDSVTSTDNCGVYHFFVNIPKTVSEIQFSYYVEEGLVWSFESAEDTEHNDLLMWSGVVGFYNGDVLLYTQSQVDSMAEKLANFSGISGDFGIYGSLSDVEDKSLYIERLEEVFNDYNLNQSFALVKDNHENDEDPIIDLSVIGNLKLSAIAGDLIVKNTTHLSSLIGLESFSLVSGDITIANNAALSSLSGLDSLEYADTLTIEGNPVLIDYGALVLLHNNLDSIHISGNYYDPTVESIALGNTDTTASVLYLSGNVAFGSATVGESASVELRVSNTGNKDLSVTSIAVPNGFVVDWMGGTIASGNSQLLSITFTPTEAIDYTGMISFEGDFDLGESEVFLMGRGVVGSGIDIVERDDVFVFPNPFTDFLYFKNTDNIKNIHLCSTLGRVVVERIDFCELFNTAFLEAGVYLVYIEYIDGRIETHVVLKK